MCQHVFKGKETYATPRQFAGVVGGLEYLRWEGSDRLLDGCLCPIDVPSTLDAAGIPWRPDRDPMFFHIDD